MIEDEWAWEHQWPQLPDWVDCAVFEVCTLHVYVWLILFQLIVYIASFFDAMPWQWLGQQWNRSIFGSMPSVKFYHFECEGLIQLNSDASMSWVETTLSTIRHNVVCEYSSPCSPSMPALFSSSRIVQWYICSYITTILMITVLKLWFLLLQEICLH